MTDHEHEEIARLRGVVEAVQALADDMETQAAESTPVMGEVWTVAAREVRRVLAPVSSSGEAESGEAANRVLADALRYYAERRPMDNPKGWDHVLRQIDHAVAAGAYGYVPAPDMAVVRAVLSSLAAPSSGGQADVGEWVCGTCGRGPVEHGWLESTCVYRPVWKPAARPVLSREALRRRLDGHWPMLCGIPGGPLAVECACDWRYDYVPNGPGRLDRWRDHLADVLHPQDGGQR